VTHQTRGGEKKERRLRRGGPAFLLPTARRGREGGRDGEASILPSPIEQREKKRKRGTQ